jgi:hypothetical protein
MPNKLPPRSLPAAYAFAQQSGCGPEIERIRTTRLTNRERRIAARALFEDRGILAAFLATLPAGQASRTRRSPRPSKRSRPVLFSPVSAESALSIAGSLGDLRRVNRELRSHGAISSQRIVGDLGEWVASQTLQLPLCSNRNQKGWDLEGDGLHVQVKAHAKGAENKAKRTSLALDALNYDGLVIVVFSSDYFLEAIYLLDRRVVESCGTCTGNRRIIRWAGIREFAISAVPSAFAPLLSSKSAIAADDDCHRAELTRLRARISGATSPAIAVKNDDSLDSGNVR